MEPHNAYYYRFYGRPENSLLPMPLSQNPSVEYRAARMVLGPEEILFELNARGCKLATEAWVDNHYGLILWKLAGMVALDPEKEADEPKRRWCWNELLRQFLYRCALYSTPTLPCSLTKSQTCADTNGSSIQASVRPFVSLLLRISRQVYPWSFASHGYVPPTNTMRRMARKLSQGRLPRTRMVNSCLRNQSSKSQTAGIESAQKWTK